MIKNVQDKYGWLTLIKLVPPTDGHTKGLFKCKCGKVVTRNISPLRQKRKYPASCGCSVIKNRKSAKQKAEEIFSPILQDFYLGRI